MVFIPRQSKTISLDALKKVDWRHLVDRKDTLLLGSFENAPKFYFHTLTDIPWHATYGLHVSDGDIVDSGRELDALRNLLVSKGVPLFRKLERLTRRYVQHCDDVSARVLQTDVARLSELAFEKMLRRFTEATLDACNFLLPMPVADRALSDMILERLSGTPEEKQQQLITLVYPMQVNEYVEEERAFFRLAAYWKNGKGGSVFDRALERHLARFEWMGARWWQWTNPWTRKEIIVRLKDFQKNGESPRRVLAHLNATVRGHVVHARRLERTLGITSGSEFGRIIRMAREYAYLRTWRTDVIYRAGYRARHLFWDVARRVGFACEDIPYLTYFEILATLERKKLAVSRVELARRREFYCHVAYEGRVLTVSGRRWHRSIRALLDTTKQVSELRGDIAYRGVHRGHVRLVFRVDDIPKVQRGDVLVAVMTFPNLIAAMKRAGAFVTDEGGILCHAAILAREMKKPCVIGTKIATQVFADGDVVEVDADRGIVRKV